MRADLQKALSHKLGKRAEFGRALAPLTTWRVGGPAWCLCTVRTAGEAEFTAQACAEAGVVLRALGRGSNLLVSDGGFDGVMLRLSGSLAKLKLDRGRMQAGGGAALIACVKLAARRGLGGLEWAAGMPASLGGAVATNAGAAGSEMAALTETVSLLLPGGEVKDIPGPELGAGYRRRELPLGALVLGAGLRLKKSEPATVAAKTQAALAKRRASQPLAARTAGSVFKNPPGDYAGRLIEAAGLKGQSIGGAMVSPRHANFIENRGSATAADILALMNLMAQRVRQRFAVELEPEVEVIGDA